MIMANNKFCCKRIARTHLSILKLHCFIVHIKNVHHGVIKTISVCELRRVYNDGFSNLQIMIRVRNN